WPLTDLTEDQLRQLDDLGVVLQHPVVPGQAAIQRAILYVTRHLLGPDERAVNLRVVDDGIVAATGKRDLVARLAKYVARGLLQAARGETELEDRSIHFL